jgi:hypothetical protein
VLAADRAVLTGHSFASVKVIAEIRNMLDVFAPIYLKCRQADSVMAGDVPEDLLTKAEKIEAPTTLVPGAKGPIQYELWTIAGCERSAQIFVKLWYLDSGEETFIASPVVTPSWDGS